MIQDIVEIKDGSDLVLARSNIGRAANVLSIQIGDLEYALTFGVDLKYFLVSEYEFQNQSFQAYLINRLVESQVNVVQCLEVIQNFVTTYTFRIGDPNSRNTEGFIV